MRVAIYARVSTGSQTTQNQLRELEAVAERSSWQHKLQANAPTCSGNHH